MTGGETPGEAPGINGVVLGDPGTRPIGDLHLDSRNPRLPIEVRGRSEGEIAAYIDRHYDALNVASSIALHGYFPSEPMIIVHEDGQDVVVEGNRRLVALRGLMVPEARASFARPREWHRLAEVAAERRTIPTHVPVVLATDRLAIAPVIGFRHITNILSWDPYSQARYIAQLIDEFGLSVDAISDLIGEAPTIIRSRYRNFTIVEQARAWFGDEVVAAAANDFGILTRALQSRGIREFIGAPEPAGVTPRTRPVPADRAERLREVLRWLFGDADAVGRVIGESRDITALGRVVASDTGIEVLRETGDLSAAVEAIGGAHARLVSRLSTALRALTAAATDLAGFRDDPQVLDLLRQVTEALEQLEHQRHK